jgi:hypothetical protein
MERLVEGLFGIEFPGAAFLHRFSPGCVQFFLCTVLFLLSGTDRR